MAAVTSAALFGAGTPLAKVLLPDVSPWLMDSLLYLGSGVDSGQSHEQEMLMLSMGHDSEID